MVKKKIAVIGGGVFGVTIASVLAKFFEVDLFEKKNDILKAASGINQFRLHRGYHYPRSLPTVLSSLDSQESFNSVYGKAIIKNTFNYYSIAKENSKTSKQQYLNFLRKNNLVFEKVDLPLVNSKSVALTLKVEENLLDLHLLRQIAWNNLLRQHVNVHLNTSADTKIKNKFDFVVVSTYSDINETLKIKSKIKRVYQFEVCEKPVVRLPSRFKNQSIVIIDGPFMCVDPFAKTGNFLMGNVVHAIHSINIGYRPRIPKKYEKLLNNGIIRNPPITNFQKFIMSASGFIPSILSAKHLGSMFTIRAVLPYKESTDERLTTIRQIDKKIFTVFSGKIGTCVNTAQELLAKVRS